MAITKSEYGVLEKLRIQASNMRQVCYKPECKNLAIRSHILQAEGPLRNISENGKVVQFTDQGIINTALGQRYRFEEKGIREGHVLIFFGFCQSCDHSIFQEVENGKADLADYRHMLLFSYRGYLRELQKQERIMNYHALILKSDRLTTATKQSFIKEIISFYIAVERGRMIKRLFEAEIFSKGEPRFEFVSRALQKVDVCTSASFSLPQLLRGSQPLNFELNPVINFFFVNLIPVESNLRFIIGKLKSDTGEYISFETLKTAPEHVVFKLISDILIKHIETWCISKHFHNSLVKSRSDKEILRLVNSFFPVTEKFKYVPFDIFQDLITYNQHDDLDLQKRF